MISVDDQLAFCLKTIRSYKLRSLLTILGIVIGITSVILLTAIGDGVKQYINNQFNQFGTGLIIMTPGKSDVLGIPGNLGGTYKNITFQDIKHLKRIPGVKAVAPVIAGQARIKYKELYRDVQVYGAVSEAKHVWDIKVNRGNYLDVDLDGEGPATAVIGPKVAQELFKNENPLGKRIRVTGYSYRIVGILEKKGELMGIDPNDSITIAAKRAMRLFNSESILEVDIKLENPTYKDHVIKRIKEVMIDRHRQDDVTVLSQDDLIASLGSIMDIMKFAVTAIAGVSLFVGAIGILTIMWICVHERRSEIGLIKAIGGTKAEIIRQFLFESSMLSLCGGAIGIICGHLIAFAIQLFVDNLPLSIDVNISLLALATCLMVGLISGIIPAIKAAHLAPVDALRSL